MISVSTVRRAAVALAVGCATALTHGRLGGPGQPRALRAAGGHPACARDNLKFK